MKALAQFVMRGPVQAAGVAAITATLPLLFWISAAVVALVLLRVSVSAGLNVALWALLPALGWTLVGQDPTALCVLLGTAAMALVLRNTASWERTLAAGAGVALVVASLIPIVLPAMFDQLVQIGTEVMQRFNPETGELQESELRAITHSVMLASLGMSQFGIAIGSIMLGRSWQAGLYNPGGFRKEFHAFRFSWPVAVGLVLLMLILPMLGLSSLLVIGVLGMPLVLAGIALVHGAVSVRGRGAGWLVGFYLMVLVFGPSLLLLLVLLAIFDSWLDIRSRIRPSNH